MDKSVKRTSASTNESRFVNLAHVAEMHQINDGKETRLSFATSGELIVKETPQQLFGSMGKSDKLREV
jgi:hypothetical protein